MAPRLAPQSPSVDHGSSDGVMSTRSSSKRKLSESNATDDSEETPSKKLRSDIPTIKVESTIDFFGEPAQPEPAKRGSRGGGRPRGRGRGRGGRGGRGGAANSARGTPSRDLLQPPFRGGRGRGGGRVKKSDNARIQALYHRKKDLKGQFKQVAAIQKEGLTELAQKSLESLEDPKYHEILPEYVETTKALNERYRRVIDVYESRMKIEVAFALRQLEAKVNYKQREFKCKIADIQDRYEAHIKQEALYVERQAKTGGNDETTPYYRGLPGEVVKYIDRPRSIVHPIATPYYPGALEVDADPYQEELHPAEWWNKMLDEAGRKAWRAADRKHKPVADLTLGDGDELAKKKPGRKSKNASPMKGKAESEPTVARMKSALYQPALHDTLTQQNDASVAVTPAEVSETEPDLDQAPTPDGDEQPMDKFGTYLPKKPIPRNGEPPQNRFVQKPHMTFDEGEIGVRIHHTKKVQREQLYLGSDPSPNPAHLHFDQFARGENSALNGPDDLDAGLVQTYRVHPTFGLPVPGCVNPDSPAQTDWNKDLEPPNPIVFVEKESGKVSHTSRSAWIIEANRKWKSFTDVDEATRDKVRSLLETLSTPEASKEELEMLQRIHSSLLDAVNCAPPPTPTSPPRRQFYDAARDTTSHIPYQTPYSQPKKRPGQSLTALADAAEHAPRHRSNIRQLSGYSMGTAPQWPPQPQPQPQPQIQMQAQPQAQPQAQYQSQFPTLQSQLLAQSQAHYQPQYGPPPPYQQQPQYALQPPFPPQIPASSPIPPASFYHHQPPLQPQPSHHPRGLRPLAPAPPLPPPTQWPRFRHS